MFAAGACPIDEDGVVVPGGIEAQAGKAVENLFAALRRPVPLPRTS